MKTLGVIANCSKELAPEVLRRLAVKAGELGVKILADQPTAALLGGEYAAAFEELVRRSDAVMALGGDGTLLRVVREMGDGDKPVIGVNIGSLGFLTSMTQESLEEALECLSAERYATSVRSAAECRLIRGGRVVCEHRALNDVVIERGPSSRVSTLNVAVRSERVTSYVCDGLIVSTPTGSTGHSLSAGGPILTPEAQVFVLSLICPHTLSSRPLVIPDGAEITIDLEAGGEHLLLTMDGQVNQALELGDRVCVRRSPRDVRLIHLPGYSYFDVLRRKLGWRGSSV